MIQDKICTINDEEGEDRHKRELNAIKNDEFNFGAETLVYIPKGKHSWKHQAIVTYQSEDLESDVFNYKPDNSFLSSDWKQFHDALQAHPFWVLHEILLRHNICAA
jgi:hypothetical protein